MSDIPTTPSSRALVTASYLLMAGALLLIMWQGLLPGLLCVCIGFLGTRWLARLLDTGLRRSLPALPQRLASRVPSWSRLIAATLVMLAPIGLLSARPSPRRATSSSTRRSSTRNCSTTSRAPCWNCASSCRPTSAPTCPRASAEVQRIIAGYLRAQAGSLALTGRAWLGGAAVRLRRPDRRRAGGRGHPRRRRAARWPQQLKQRITLFGEAFGQIVAAQFWIAAFNTFLTAIFLLFLLPIWELELPYTPALITLTFVAGLVPIVGNLVVQHRHHAGGALGVADHRAGLPGAS